METEKIKKIAFSYMDGDSDKVNETSLFEFLSQSEDNKTLFYSWEMEWKKDREVKADVNLLVNLEDKITSRKRKRILCGASCAAAIAVLTGIFLSYESSSLPSAEISTMTVIETGPCDRTRVSLPDGSSVSLNSCSRIAYSSSFNRSDRNVTLSGEAMFDVAPNEGSPFVVSMGKETVTVKGTTFNVTAYERTGEISVALLDGKVEFSEGETVLAINPGEVLIYDKGSHNLSKSADDVSKYSLWTEGRIEYASVRLEELLDRLACIYNLDIRYSPVKYADKTFCISLSTEENIRDILDAISVIAPIKWTRDRNVIIINEI